ncbi:hypothetical protein AJ80_02931 [Polytolypa hystricis UAMH7299]|uniref:BZIP domain-containing protein n=1 Tax=Polytolypa hystricis (strain UAMH7299) TaxID=1447883 RepID=A0A2B7YN30_POLH7|nr:hypothetical protein AJ80_02931 [Polytolypa hystricis UAMH7299]
MESPFSSFSAMSPSPGADIPQLTISPSETTLKFEEGSSSPTVETPRPEEKKPVKKRKSWGQELPIPKTNLPPRKRAKTEDEKEQRRIERVLRNRAAAQTSRERKRLEVERLEGQKKEIEEQNEFLVRRLAQMEAENNRLNQQVAQLSAEIRSSRGTSPQSVSGTASPTLAPVLFKKELDELSIDKIPFQTPINSESTPIVKASDPIETPDMTQHPAAVLCDLQCQSAESMNQQALHNPSLTPDQMWMLALQAIMQHLFLTMTSTVYSTVMLPLSQIFHSLKEGSPLMFSPEEIHQHLPLILWLISTPSLSTLTASSPRSVFRIKLLTRLLECSPALARPLRDATSRALQLAASDLLPSGRLSSGPPGSRGPQDWELLLTTIWAIDCIEKSAHKQKMSAIKPDIMYHRPSSLSSSRRRRSSCIKSPSASRLRSRRSFMEF